VRTLGLMTTFSLILASLYLVLSSPAHGKQQTPPVVLILVKQGLTWNSVENEPGLKRVFDEGSVASLSTAQGAKPPDSRIGYIFLSAGSRVDTSVLPKKLPVRRADISTAFQGPASTVHPGALGDALKRSHTPATAVGERAALVVMDSEGRVPREYAAGEPVRHLEDAIQRGAKFVAVEADGPRKAADVSSTALSKGAIVAIAAPTAPAGSTNLTPFVMSGQHGVLYSPGTRTPGLISNEDVAPTLLARLDVAVPPGMTGRVAGVHPGDADEVARYQERISFVAAKRPWVWAFVGGASAIVLLLAAMVWRRRGIRLLVPAIAALPLGALLTAAIPITDVPGVAALTVLLAGGAAALSWRLSGETFDVLAGVMLATAFFIAVDAGAGGKLMGLSIMGHNPASGARFYGIGNEYSAILGGALPVGAAILAARKPAFVRALPVVGTFVVLAVGLPTMGADVGGSLALGFGLGITVGLLREEKLWKAGLWAAGGLFFAAALFLLSGLLFPDVSHGARAASGESGLYEILVRKLLLSLGHLLNPVWTGILIVELGAIYAGWRMARGSALAAGILGGAATAGAMGALNDSGIISTIITLAYPAAACITALLSREERPSRASV